jgi:hypothetical protein
MRLDRQLVLFRAAQIGLPLSVVFGMGGALLGFCTLAIIAGFLLWEWQSKPRNTEPTPEVNLPKPIAPEDLPKPIAKEDLYRVLEVLNPKGPTFF